MNDYIVEEGILKKVTEVVVGSKEEIEEKLAAAQQDIVRLQQIIAEYEAQLDLFVN